MYLTVLFLSLPNNGRDQVFHFVLNNRYKNVSENVDLRVQSDIFGNSYSFPLRKALLNEHDTLDLSTLNFTLKLGLRLLTKEEEKSYINNSLFNYNVSPFYLLPLCGHRLSQLNNFINLIG